MVFPCAGTVVYGRGHDSREGADRSLPPPDFLRGLINLIEIRCSAFCWQDYLIHLLTWFYFCNPMAFILRSLLNLWQFRGKRAAFFHIQRPWVLPTVYLQP